MKIGHSKPGRALPALSRGEYWLLWITYGIWVSAPQH